VFSGILHSHIQEFKLHFHPSRSLLIAQLFSNVAVLHILQKSCSHLNIPGAGKVTFCRFLTVETKILGATVENLVSKATWQPGFVHPLFNLLIIS
jgi:hypothetical protein